MGLGKKRIKRGSIIPQSRIVFRNGTPKIGNRVAAIDGLTGKIIYVGTLAKNSIATTHFSQGGRLVPREETFRPNWQAVNIVKIRKKPA